MASVAGLHVPSKRIGEGSNSAPHTNRHQVAGIKHAFEVDTPQALRAPSRKPATR
jgi:hypothetical protein